MVIKRTDGKWLIKKKFTFAAMILLVATIIAGFAINLSTNSEEVVMVLTTFGNVMKWLAGLVFAADVSDKWFNGGKYNDKGD